MARTERYLRTPAVVGFENPFLDVLEADLRAAGRTVERHQSLLAAPGDGPVMISAHVDRHGLITTDTHELDYAAKEASGAHHSPTSSLAAAICGRFEKEAVVAYDPKTGAVLGGGEVEHSDFCGIAGHVHLAVAGLASLPAGLPVSFALTSQFENGWLRGQIDNAISAAIIMESIVAGFDGSALFTCGEEVGRSWQPLMAWLPSETNQLIVLDTSPFDTHEVPEQEAVVLRHRDAGGVFDVARTALLESAALGAGAKIVWKDDLLEASGRPLGRTELGRLIAATGGAMTGSTLQVPTTDYHSSREATTTAAISASIRTLSAYLGL